MTDARDTDRPLSSDLALALRLADLADGISSAHFRERGLHIDTKPDRTFVTEADLAVERAIRDALATERPGDGILGEEYGTEGDARRQWIIDPIDGTSNYLRGVPVWGTLIALAVDGTPVVGVVSSPALGKRWWAAAGDGAWTTDAPGAQPRPIRVSAVADLEHASISFQSIAQWDQAGYLDRLIALTRRVWRDRAYGDMWSYMLLAEGLLLVHGRLGGLDEADDVAHAEHLADQPLGVEGVELVELLPLAHELDGDARHPPHR